VSPRLLAAAGLAPGTTAVPIGPQRPTSRAGVLGLAAVLLARVGWHPAGAGGRLDLLAALRTVVTGHPHGADLDWLQADLLAGAQLLLGHLLLVEDLDEWQAAPGRTAGQVRYALQLAAATDVGLIADPRTDPRQAWTHARAMLARTPEGPPAGLPPADEIADALDGIWAWPASRPRPAAHTAFRPPADDPGAGS